MARILLVDDDQNHLNAMWRVFLLDGEHEVERFTDPAAALDRAREQSFDTVIADYRMPSMDGVHFLKAFRELQPQAFRIIISGFSEMELFKSAINSAHIHHFLEKPCDGRVLLQTVKQGLTQKRLDTELHQLRQKLKQAGDVLGRIARSHPELVPEDVLKDLSATSE